MSRQSYVFLIPLTIFICIGLFLWKGLSLKPAELPSVLIGHPAPQFRLVLDPHLSGDISGIVTEKIFIGQVTILNVWSSYCRPCQAEHAFWQTLNKNYSDFDDKSYLQDSKHSQYTLIGLNYHDDLTEAQHWLETNGNPYHINLFDQEGKLAMDFGVYGTPETFILDKQGIIRHRHVGAVDQKIWQNELLPIIEKLK